MDTQLTVFLGADFDTGLIQGMVRNGKSVLWHREGILPRGLRRGYAGIDWVYRSESAALWEHVILERVREDSDRCILLSEPLRHPPKSALGIKTGTLPWPISLRQLLNVLKRPVGEPDHQFSKYCRESFAEWETVQKAKETLIHRHGCTEPEAYAVLRRMSMDRSTTIREVARSVMVQV